MILDTSISYGFSLVEEVFIVGSAIDPGARSLSTYERGAVAEYLQIIDGGEYMKKKVNLPGDKIHHSIKYITL